MSLETLSSLNKEAAALLKKLSQIEYREGGKSEDLRALREVSEPGPSSQDALQQTEMKNVNVSTYWDGTRSTKEPRKLQRDDPDTGQLPAAKLPGS